MKNFFSRSLVGSVLLFSTIGWSHFALAEEHRAGWHDVGGVHHGGWHGDFHPHDIDRWHGGHWYHGVWGDRLGWYWIIGSTYYYYPTPVYPYPDPYIPSEVMVQQTVPSVPVATPAPAPAPAPQTSAVWYYCEASKTYYPYVKECPAGWKTVPATPPGQ